MLVRSVRILWLKGKKGGLSWHTLLILFVTLTVILLGYFAFKAYINAGHLDPIEVANNTQGLFP